MWKIYVIIFLVLLVAGLLFYDKVVDGVTGGRAKLDPSFPPQLFAVWLVAGTALIYFVFYIGLYEILLNNIHRHPAGSALLALIVFLVVVCAWFAAQGTVYYWLWNPAPTAAAHPLLRMIYPYTGIAALAVILGGVMLAFKLSPKR